MIRLIFLLMSAIVAIVAANPTTAEGNKCVYMDYPGKKLNLTHIGCPDNDICAKHFNISYIETPPYQGIPVTRILKKCCGTCAKYSDMVRVTILLSTRFNR